MVVFSIKSIKADNVADRPRSFGKDSRQLVRDSVWYNSGPPPELLRQEFITPGSCSLPGTTERFPR
jgi:hypothetical protein